MWFIDAGWKKQQQTKSRVKQVQTVTVQPSDSKIDSRKERHLRREGKVEGYHTQKLVLNKTLPAGNHQPEVIIRGSQNNQRQIYWIIQRNEDHYRTEISPFKKSLKDYALKRTKRWINCGLV